MDSYSQNTAPEYGAIGRTNFTSAFNSAFFCTAAALLIDLHAPVFRGQGFHVLLTGALFALPLLLMPECARYLTTRYSSRNAVLIAKCAEFVFFLACTPALLFFPAFNATSLSGAVVLLGVCYAVFRPALKIYTAETVSKTELPFACTVTECTTFAGIASGASLGAFVIYSAQSGNIPLWYGGVLGALLAFGGVIFCTALEPTLAPGPHQRFSKLPRTWFGTLRRHEHWRELVLTGLGESYIFCVIIFGASLAVQYIAAHLSITSDHPVLQYLTAAAPVIGAGTGCIISCILSRHRAEIGLVPPAVLLMSASVLLIGILPYAEDTFIESGLLGILLFAFGFFAGMMLIPLESYQEYFVHKELRSPFFAWFYFPFGILLLLAIGMSFLLYFYQIPIFYGALGLALFTLIPGALVFWLMPVFLLRMCMKILLRVIYRLRIWNPERIPEEGPALLVANRASFVDIFFVSACTTRPVRFLMHESYFEVPFWGKLFRAAGFISVPAGKPKKLVELFEYSRNLLRRGELICIFPEGEITRNGLMSSFTDGISVLLPPELNVPVIPVRIGMTWGSIFSCYYGKFKLTLPDELPHPASVTIGKPMKPESSAYEIRIILSELAAETEMIPSASERPFHAQFLYTAKRHLFDCCVGEFNGEKWNEPSNLKLLTFAILISRKLRRRGWCENEQYIGLMLPNGVAAAAGFFGILFADRTPAVLNYTASAASIDYAIQNAGIKRILTSRVFIEKIKLAPRPEMVFLEDLVPRLGGRGTRLFWLLTALLVPADELIKLLSPESWRDVHRIAVLIFSSGSTGTPKGVMLSHHNITGDVTAVIKSIGWTRNDRILGNLPMFHSFGISVCFWLPVLTGAHVTMIPNPLDGKAAVTALRERKLSILMATPGFFMLYMRNGKPEDFKSVRFTVSGAEKLRADIAERYFKMTGLAIAEGYGCTELSPIVSVNVANSRMELGVEVAKRGTIGPPITGVCVKIVDPDTFELRGENQDGLMIVKGANVMLGYLNEPEKTAEVIRDGWYITGDIAHMDRNGFITVTGRLSRFSKIAGEMVPHELVERELNNILLPDCRLFAVGSAADSRRGEKLLVFYIDNGSVHPEILVRQLRERKVPNLWIPKQENFIPVPSLPMLGSGKLDLQKLAEMCRAYDEKEENS